MTERKQKEVFEFILNVLFLDLNVGYMGFSSL